VQKTSDPKLQAQLFAVLQHDMQRMQRLITDISDASRLDAEISRASMEKVDLAAMLHTLVEMYQSSAPEIIFETKLPKSLLVSGLELRLGQVLRNILDNAISFSPPQGKISIVLAKRAHAVLLTIDDQGPGIPADNINDIFKRFYSERPASESFGQHSGLGLAISKQIVEAHGGTLVAENLEPHGARFNLTLPIS
jgi:two-component system, OmpR family, sensor histidine kinase ChvG